MRARLFDHGGKVLLPDLVMFNAGPLAQRVLMDPGGFSIGHSRLAGDGAPHGLERGAIAFHHKLESAEVLPVLLIATRQLP